MLGYPVLSMRSVPKDETWLAHVLRRGPEERAHQDAAGDQRRLARELLGQLGAEGVGGQVRRPPPQRRRAGSVVVQVRARRPHLRHHRQHHRHRADALLGAARHRRQQAGRVDQDPGQDLRPQPGPAQGAAGGRRPRPRDELAYRIESKRLELLRAEGAASWPSAAQATRRWPSRSTRPSRKVQAYEACPRRQDRRRRRPPSSADAHEEGRDRPAGHQARRFAKPLPGCERRSCMGNRTQRWTLDFGCQLTVEQAAGARREDVSAEAGLDIDAAAEGVRGRGAGQAGPARSTPSTGTTR